MRRSRPPRLATLLVGALAVIGTGCAGVPLEGPIAVATPDSTEEVSDVRIEARRPIPGATPDQIVEGFLDAMSQYQFGFSIAGDFLTPAARDAWDRTRIEVYTGTTLERTGPSIVRLVADRAATIDATGRFSAPPPGSDPLEHSFRLVEDEAGEWRIDDPPNYLLINSFDLRSDYSHFITYFPDPEGRVLVPDEVWLPSAEPQIALLLAQTVVDGPTTLIGPRGVMNPFPPGTQVSSAVVDPVDDVVTIELAGAAIAETDDEARRLMVAQLADTMVQLGVERVELTIGGESVDLPDASASLTALAGFADPPAYFLSESSAVLAVDPTDETATPTPVPGILGRGEVPSRSLAISLDRTTAVTVGDLGTQVLRTPLTDGVEPDLIYVGEDVAAPSFDRFGNVWLVDRRGDGRSTEVKLIAPDGGAIAVAAPELASTRVAALRIAPDGVRVAVVPEQAGAMLRLGHVIRGAAPEIDLTVDIAFDGAVTGVAWAGPTELLVVVRTEDGLSRPYSVSVDGATVTEGSVTGISAVAAYANSEAFTLTDAGNVLRQTSILQWVQVTRGRAVTYPG